MGLALFVSGKCEPFANRLTSSHAKAACLHAQSLLLPAENRVESAITRFSKKGKMKSCGRGRMPLVIISHVIDPRTRAFLHAAFPYIHSPEHHSIISE